MAARKHNGHRRRQREADAARRRMELLAVQQQLTGRTPRSMARALRRATSPGA